VISLNQIYWSQFTRPSGCYRLCVYKSPY